MMINLTCKHNIENNNTSNYEIKHPKLYIFDLFRFENTSETVSTIQENSYRLTEKVMV